MIERRQEETVEATRRIPRADLSEGKTFHGAYEEDNSKICLFDDTTFPRRKRIRLREGPKALKGHCKDDGSFTNRSNRVVTMCHRKDVRICSLSGSRRGILFKRGYVQQLFPHCIRVALAG